MKRCHLNEYKKHFLLSFMMVYTFLHIPVYIYRVGMGRPSCTPVLTSCPRYPRGRSWGSQKSLKRLIICQRSANLSFHISASLWNDRFESDSQHYTFHMQFFMQPNSESLRNTKIQKYMATASFLFDRNCTILNLLVFSLLWKVVSEHNTNLSLVWGADRKIRPRITVWHHEALPSDIKQWSQGTDFSIRNKKNMIGSFACHLLIASVLS